VRTAAHKASRICKSGFEHCSNFSTCFACVLEGFKVITEESRSEISSWVGVLVFFWDWTGSVGLIPSMRRRFAKTTASTTASIATTAFVTRIWSPKGKRIWSGRVLFGGCDANVVDGGPVFGGLVQYIYGGPTSRLSGSLDPWVNLALTVMNGAKRARIQHI